MEERYLWDQQKCRGDKTHGNFNKSSLIHLGNLFGTVQRGNWIILNPNANGDKIHGFHITCDISYEQAHITCQAPNGTKNHISAKAPKEQIESWYNNCCQHTGQQPDPFIEYFITTCK